MMKSNSRIQTTGLIIEGVTGAGKTQTLSALRAFRSFSSMEFIDEDPILGDVMGHLNDPERSSRDKWTPLLRILHRIESSPATYLLERFHPTFFALVPNWDLFREVDDELARRDFRMVFLQYDEDQLSTRGLNRVDRRGTGWIEGMKEIYGGESAAVNAISTSQKRRIDCLAATKLLTLKINTTGMQWQRYAEEIASFMGKG